MKEFFDWCTVVYQVAQILHLNPSMKDFLTLSWLYFSHYLSYPEPLPVLEGVMTPNDKLRKSERLFQDKLIGPESLAFDNSGTYTKVCTAF